MCTKSVGLAGTTLFTARMAEKPQAARAVPAPRRLERTLMKVPKDLVVTDVLQRLQAWSDVAGLAGIEQQAVFEMARLYSEAVCVPVCGAAVQRQGSDGFDPDGFMLQRGTFKFQARSDLRAARLEFWLPAGHQDDVEVTAECGDCLIRARGVPGTLLTIELALEVKANEEHTFAISCSRPFQPSAAGTGSRDNRRLGGVVVAVEFS